LSNQIRVETDGWRKKYNDAGDNLRREILEKCAFSTLYRYNDPSYLNVQLGYFECPALTEMNQLQSSFQGTYFFSDEQIVMTGFSSNVGFQSLPLSITAEIPGGETKQFILFEYSPFQEALYLLLEANGYSWHNGVALSIDELNAEKYSENKLSFTRGQSFEDAELSHKKKIVQLINFEHRVRFDVDRGTNTILKYKNLEM